MREPVRLQKKEDLFDKIEAWAYAHAPLLLLLFLIMLVVLFVILCFAVCGISAVESGVNEKLCKWGCLN